MTHARFTEDPYLSACEAKVTALAEQAVCLDQSVFYAESGGQPGDTGWLERAGGERVAVLDTRYEPGSGRHLHYVEDPSVFEVGEQVKAEIDWPRRHRLMRMHSCLHMLCALIDAPVTGGSVRDGSGRLDFDLPEPPDREALEQRLNELIAEAHPRTFEWITPDELRANPHLVRTLSVAPPLGQGKVRLVKFGTADLQPCGGTHVANSREIGQVRITSIKKKGRQNRRINVELLE